MGVGEEVMEVQEEAVGSLLGLLGALGHD